MMLFDSQAWIRALVQNAVCLISGLSTASTVNHLPVQDAGLDKDENKDAFEKIDKTRAGVLIGSGMGGLTVFQDGVVNMVEKGHRKISPFFIPYAITNM